MSTIRYVPLPLRFVVPPPSMWVHRLDRILASWEDTPYRPGQHVRGVGTYCTAFVCAVLDELYRQPSAALPEDIPIDASMHDPELARSGLRWFLTRYPNHVRVQDGTVEPGDVLVTGPVSGGPGHAIIAGPRKGTLWQCSGRSVHRAGYSLPETYRLHAVYRMTDRHKWS